MDLKKAGNRYLANCPLHEDSTPSFVVYEHTNSFFCFGCQVGGGPLQFLMHFKKISRTEAIEQLGLGSISAELDYILSPSQAPSVDYNTQANYIVSRQAREKVEKGGDLDQTMAVLRQFDQALLTQKFTEETAKEWITKVQNL